MQGNAFVDATAGVTIFLENGGTYSASGNSAIHITAPSSGPYQGVGFFQSRSNVAPLNIQGNVDFDVDGTVYVPNAQISLQGDAGRRFGRLLAGSLDLGGNATVTIDGSLVPPSGPRVPCLVE
jgi:hypothetical protein